MTAPVRTVNAEGIELIKTFEGLKDGEPRYQAATKRYLANSSDVQLFGILIRDVDPHKDDVRVRVDKLADGCPEGTSIEVLALYLPKGKISELSAMAFASRDGGSA